MVALQRLLSPDSQADDQVQVTAHSVASAVDQYLVALTQDTTLDDADRSIVQHINTTFRNRWWGLFVCYDVSGLPSTNNALEGFFGRLKTNQRLITGRKSVNNFVLRYGSFAAFVDPTETKDELLFRLRSVDRSAYLFERQRLHSILAERKDYFRFCHHLDSVVSELEIAWESALLSNTNRHDSDSPSNST
ncbi:hypothetical protein KFU94_30425 [Chloroflexi bacterium TSY]|nr:hypothetical protein [Chloroflexi bacterium TSY]MBV7332001.1 hypothetical protein [Chloroflexi bacterium TSY]MBV7332448.1 hypothetical protein [Chloroflexi bacterium TSY]MBV7332469.1 hypothetical protein [Chloroflexi bacterium TSY]